MINHIELDTVASYISAVVVNQLQTASYSDTYWSKEKQNPFFEESHLISATSTEGQTLIVDQKKNAATITSQDKFNIIVDPYSHIQEQIGQLKEYLDKLGRLGVITPLSSKKYYEAWHNVNQALSTKGIILPIPNACPSPDGEMLFTWDSDQHHFEYELNLDDTVEYYYKNRYTRLDWYAEGIINQLIPDEAIEKLSYFCI